MEREPDHVGRIMAQWRTERPDLDVSPQGVIGRLHRIGARLTEELVAEYSRFGLGEGDFDVLATLRRSGAPYELTPGELVASTMVTSGAVSKRVDRLVEQGLATRRVGEHDARGRVIGLTAKGRQAHRPGVHRPYGQRAPAARRPLRPRTDPAGQPPRDAGQVAPCLTGPYVGWSSWSCRASCSGRVSPCCWTRGSARMATRCSSTDSRSRPASSSVSSTSSWAWSSWGWRGCAAARRVSGRSCSRWWWDSSSPRCCRSCPRPTRWAPGSGSSRSPSCC